MAKKRQCQTCQRTLPPSLFEGKGKVCHFCKFPNHNPLKDLLDQRDKKISELSNNLLSAQSPKRSISQDINLFLSEVGEFSVNMVEGNWETKRSIYFQTMRQCVTANLFAHLMGVDRSMAVSAIMEYIFHGLPDDFQRKVERMTEEERKRFENKKKKMSDV